MKKNQFIKNVIIAAFTLTHCGEGSNINAPLFADPNERSYSVEFLMAKAVHYYDIKDYPNAETYANKVLAINPQNEDASTLMGYVNLANAGIEIFGLIDRMIEMNSTDSTKTTSTGSSGLTTSTAATSTATSILEKLQKAIFPYADQMNQNLTTTTVKVDDGTTLDGANTADYGTPASTYTIRFPVTTTEARKGVDTVIKINEAIMSICSMVNSAAKAVNPDRYGSCPVRSENVKQSAKVHFLWGLAHLTEAVAFYPPLMLAVKPLEARVTSLKTTSTSPSDISSFISKINELSKDAAYIFPSQGTTTQQTSLLGAIFNDLKTTNLAFAQIEGMPTQVTDSINNALNSLLNAQDKIKTGTDTSTIGTSAKGNVNAAQIDKLKDQFTGTMAKNLGDKVTTINDKNPLSTEQKTNACGAIKNLSSTTYNSVSLCTQ